MRILIVGTEDVAFRLASVLMQDHEVFFVCEKDQMLGRGDDLDVQYVYGLATSIPALEQAGASEADVFIAAGPQDENNLVACVLGRQLGAKKTICFLFRRDFVLLHPGSEASSITESVGIDLAIRPAQQLAEEILRIVSFSGALDMEMFLDGRVQLVRHAIGEGALLTQATLAEIKVPKDVVFVMARRGDQMFIPSGSTRFEAGDKITCMGTRRALRRVVTRQMKTPGRGPDAHTATVVGGGVVGMLVAQGLSRSGWRVKLIEASEERCHQLAGTVDVLVLHGDGTDLKLLEQEQVGQDSVLIAVTSNDEKNLLVSLIAKRLGVPRIVTRADNTDNERLFEMVGVDVVRSAGGAAVNKVLRAVITGRTEMLAELEHGDAEVIELEIPGAVKSVQIAALRRPVFAIIGAIVRGKKVIVPRGTDEIRGGDRLLIFCTREDEEATRDFFLRDLPRE